MEQTPLFLDEYVFLNSAGNALNDLKLDDAHALLTDYRNLYPKNSNDVDEKLSVVAFLKERLTALPPSGPERPRLLLETWEALEALCASLERNAHLPERLKARFFSLIAAAVEAESLPDDFFLNDDIPVGYVYLQTGQYERAVRSLQICLLTVRDNAAVFGYLGDGWMARGKTEPARQLYFEACLISPCAVDWDRLRDEELRELLKTLPDSYGWGKSLACEWLPVCAYIGGIFRPKMIRGLDEMRLFTESYLELQKRFRVHPDPVLAARIFTKGIVICDNEPFLRHIRGIDFVEIRRDMQAAEPRLFAGYMKELDRRRRG